MHAHTHPRWRASGPINELTRTAVLIGIGNGLYSVPSQRTAELTLYI